MIRQLLLIPILIFFTHQASSQSNEIRIEFIGNCGLHMTDGKLDIYTDFPYKSGAYGYMEYDVAELDSIKENAVHLFTHRHNDHHSGKLMKSAMKHKHCKQFGSWNIAKLMAWSKTIPDFSIEAIKTKHRFSLSHYSYVIIWHGKKIYLSGDTESAETIGKVKGIDYAFVPGWIMTDAYEKKMKVDAKQFYVYHLYPNQKVNPDIPKNVKLMDTQGMMISIPY